jgi:hypothetical protein
MEVQLFRAGCQVVSTERDAGAGTFSSLARFLGHHREEQEHREDDQVHDALEHRGATRP